MGGAICISSKYVFMQLSVAVVWVKQCLYLASKFIMQLSVAVVWVKQCLYLGVSLLCSYL